MRSIFQVTLLVREYEEAIRFYVHTLGFRLVEDTVINDQQRWVVVAVERGCALVLVKSAEQAIGNQAGKRVGFFLGTDDIQRDIKRLTENGVRFVRQAEEMPYGTVAVFEDLYGNQWDLIQHADGHHFAFD